MKKSTHSQITAGLFILIFCVFTSIQTAWAAGDKTQLTYRLKWLFNISSVGALYALEDDLFAKEGLEVTIKEGGPERDAIKELELGYAQFGVASADQVIRARAKGAPVVVIAQLFQVNPLQWLYRPSRISLQKLSDLNGKTIGITYGGNDETVMRTLLSKAGIADRSVKFFSVRYDYTPFYQNRADLWPVYRNAQGIIIGEKLRQAGEDVSFFNPEEFDVQFVANSVVTSEEMARKHPEIVEKFARALLLGWDKALDPAREQESITMLKKYERDTPENILTKQLAATRKLIQPSSDVTIGTIDRKGWQMTEKIMLDQKQIPSPVFVEKYLDQYPKK